jgi:tRNA nucleotidyltransferase (CCA-adding enzyme)
MELPDYVSKLLNELNSHGYEAYVVGGAVRSWLLHQPIHDYDLTTNAMPLEIKEVFAHYHTIDTGIRHGTVTVIIDHHPIEITTYRKDVGYQDHRHPNHVEFTSALKEDCMRRDFTINALCYHPDAGIIDFFHGIDDISNKIIRCIGDPEKRFNEDALRILRAIRFSARLSFSIEPHTREVLFRMKDTLSYVSAERITQEFTGTLQSRGCSMVLEDDKEVLEVFLPELKRISEKDYAHLVQLLDEETTGRADIRMAMILSYIHSVPLSKHVLKRMKYPNTFIDTCIDLIRHGADEWDDDISFRLLLHDLHTDVDTFFAFRKAMSPSLSLTRKKRQYAKLTNDAYCWDLKQLKITGKDLLAMHVKGKEIGRIMNLLLDDVMHEKYPNEREVLLEKAAAYRDRTDLTA